MAREILKDVFYRQFADIRKEEWPRALLMSAFFFLVIATFWVLKPLKRGVIIDYFGERPLEYLGFTFTGAEAEQIGKFLNVFAVYLFIVLFTWIVRRFPRHYLVLILAALFGGAFVFWAAFIDRLTDTLVWTFYVFGDVYNTAFVVTFWAFTNDIMRPDQAKRTYGIVGLGGVVGGFVGATVVSARVEEMGRAPLLLLLLVPMALIVAIAFTVHHMETAGQEEEAGRGAAAGPARMSAMWEGARLVTASRYLLAILGIITVYEIVSNIVDFQLAATVEREIAVGLEKDAFFGLVGQITGVGSIFVQLFLTAFVMRAFGLQVALSFLPVAILAGSAGFFILPSLAFAAAMSVSDNALNYSINQSAKEALYTPTDPDAKYKAKAFIDGFMQRFAKVISVFVNLVFVNLVVGRVRFLSLVVVAVVLGWFFLVRYAGRRFREMEEAGEVPEAVPVGA